MVRQRWVGAVGLFALAYVGLVLVPAFAFEMAAKDRFGASGPIRFVTERVTLGMSASEVARVLPSDRVQFYRLSDGTIAIEYVFVLHWAPDFQCFLVYREGVVIGREFDKEYLGKVTVLSDEKARQELGVSNQDG